MLLRNKHIGVLLLSIVLCLGFIACSSDDEPVTDASALVGTEWKGVNGSDYTVVVKITSGSRCAITVYYPNSTMIFNSKVCDYVYDEATGRFILNYSDDLYYDDYAMQGYIKGNVMTVTDKYATYTLRKQ